MPVTDVDVQIRPSREDDLPGVLELLRLSLAGGPTGERTAAFFRWKHHDNPFGHSVSLIAEADGRIVGFRTFMRWRFLLGDRPIQAVRAVDTATHPEHRGQGIFTRLTTAALDLLRPDHALVFNTPNHRSLPGYLKMGWQEVGTVPISIRPVRPLRFLRGVRHVGRGEPARAVPTCPFRSVADVLDDHAPAIAGLLAALPRAPDRLVTDRSLRYLWWRYAAAPDLAYRAIDVWDGDDLVGLAIGRPRMRGPLAEFTLGEVLHREGDRRTVNRLLRAAARAGCDHVATHLPAGTRSRWRTPLLGYLRVPGQGMTLVANPLQTLTVDPFVLSSWQLCLGDLEVF